MTQTATHILNDTRVLQEVYCNDCGGYIKVPLQKKHNNAQILIICPNCGRKHPRKIENGQVKDNRNANEGKGEEIFPMKSAYKKTSWTGDCKPNARNGHIINHNDAVGKSLLARMWSNKKG